MEDINEYLDEGATAAEREAAGRVLEGLRALQRQEKVQAAATARQQLARARWWRLLFGALALLLMSGGLAWWWNTPTKEEEPSLTPPTEEVTNETLAPPPTEQVVPEEAPPTLPEEQVSEPQKAAPPISQPEEPSTVVEPSSLPIAEANIPPPAYGAPSGSLRGNSSEKSARQAMLDQLWYTDYPLRSLKLESAYLKVDSLLRTRSFPQAYIGLQRLSRQVAANDTLQYLQAYTMMEMGQGKAAHQLLSNLQDAPTAWQPQISWYQVLSHLLAGEDEAALTIAQELATQEAHPYQLQAAKLILTLGKE